MKNKNVSTGLIFGVIIGLVYCILLYWRWSSASNMIAFGAISLASYLIILGLMFYEAYYRRKENEGYITLKHLFQTLFISVLVFELFYLAYNFIHLKYIDPNVIERMKLGMREMLDQAGDQISEADKEKQIAALDKLNEATQISKVVLSYFTNIAISGVFALLISLIMRKRKPEFENEG